VVNRADLLPLRSMIALVTKVVLWMITIRAENATPELLRSSVAPSINVLSGSVVLVSSLWMVN